VSLSGILNTKAICVLYEAGVYIKCQHPLGNIVSAAKNKILYRTRRLNYRDENIKRCDDKFSCIEKVLDLSCYLKQLCIENNNLA